MSLEYVCGYIIYKPDKKRQTLEVIEQCWCSGLFGGRIYFMQTCSIPQSLLAKNISGCAMLNFLNKEPFNISPFIVYVFDVRCLQHHSRLWSDAYLLQSCSRRDDKRSDEHLCEGWRTDWQPSGKSTLKTLPRGNVTSFKMEVGTGNAVQSIF